ncbi:DUF58 domain-containing protein [Paenibacillus motobuensis]|uniref:DUF58 domain-containing protein n=1 Tax=Paenibacillus TaxID=44249 RepID=UPI00203AF8FA|nr:MULTISPECIES: DUF58 domain-containing protein [Paenibacillus]MCM3039030.1 DUF58 domain-containing protein [Paenibacillus lutimineralis]MCM3646134.1 DUF58 domain-containing protein [Paenibacillus motobuensis]
MTAPLLPPALLPRLERLSLMSGRRVRGTAQGKRRSGSFGASLEFADYRQYSPGDDIRRFDWSVYSRTGRPFVRQYWDEQELPISLYLDVSASMDYRGAGGATTSGHAAGLHSETSTAEGSTNGSSLGGIFSQERRDDEDSKLHYARQLAAAVGYIALAGSDRVQAYLFNSKMEATLPPLRSKAAAVKLFSFIQSVNAGGAGNMASALGSAQSMPRQPGMAWIFSDLWLEGGLEELKQSLEMLQAARQEIILVHILSREELNPRLSGDLRLIDIELGTGKEVAITGKILDKYMAALERYTEGISRYCNERGIRYVMAPCDQPLETGIFETLRKTGAIGV